jgi:hypothetical protein
LPFRPPRVSKAVLPPVEREVPAPEVAHPHPDRVVDAAAVLEVAAREERNKALLQDLHPGSLMESPI